MGRNRVKVKIVPYLRNFLQNFADNQATIRAINTYFKEPECGELTEGMYCWAETVCDKLCFMNGMFSEEKRPRIYAKMKSITITNGLNTDLKINKPVYDIEFELIKE